MRYLTHIPAYLLTVLAACTVLPGSAQAAQTTRWIVELDATPAVLADAARATPAQRRALRAVADRSTDSAHTTHQRSALREFELQLHRPLVPEHSFQHALVGFVLTMNRDEANKIAELPGVRRVIPDEMLAPLEMDTQRLHPTSAHATTRSSGFNDPVAQLIGATQVWDGSALNDAGHYGEGVVVGVTGTGINGSHPSFAAIGDDGYEHINPLGAGQYLGECFATADLTCNSKLIGRYDFSGNSNLSSEDDSGYSSFVTGQAVGNIVSRASINGLGIDMVSGVAPHANLIAYRTCGPLCSGNAVLQAFDQAIEDGVDVLVHPIGSASTSPWDNIIAQAARTMRAAGISFTYTVGTGGPAPDSIALALVAPWTASFGTSTHGRPVGSKKLTGFSGGTTPPPGLNGRALTTGVEAAIVYAGDYPNPSAPDTDPALCTTAWPPGTFDGEILVCDRGAISRIMKGVHASQSGASGMVLANVTGDADSVVADAHVLPAIHIDAAAATALRSWLADGANHRARIAVEPSPTDPIDADQLLAASGRGPNLGLEFIAPSLTAPAVEIVAPTSGGEAYAYGNGRGSAPGAGALALLKSARPDLSAAELLSALMTTAVAPLREEDGQTLTSVFDHGAGRIDVARAARAGLVLDVTDAQFIAADPATGGEPRDLNLAGLVDLNCVEGCTWTRTLRATTDDTWRATTTGSTPDASIVVTPQEFTVDEGDLVEVTVTLSAAAPLTDGNVFGHVQWLPDSESASPATLQIAARFLNDSDGDAIANVNDNCLLEANADQRDSDNDGFGNLCDADLNNDDIVNVLDLGLFSQAFDSADPNSDFDGSGLVDLLDLAILRDAFLAPPGPSGVAN